MFMLRMISSNSGDFVCTQVLHNLWKLFLFKKFVLNNGDTHHHEVECYTSDENNNNSSSTTEHIIRSSTPTAKKIKLKTTRPKKKNPFLNKIFKETPATSKRIQQYRSFKFKPSGSSSLLETSKENPTSSTLKASTEVRRIQSIKRILNRPKTTSNLI